MPPPYLADDPPILDWWPPHTCLMPPPHGWMMCWVKLVLVLYVWRQDHMRPAQQGLPFIWLLCTRAERNCCTACQKGSKMKAQATRRLLYEFHLHESAQSTVSKRRKIQSTVSCRCDTNSDRNLGHFAWVLSSTFEQSPSAGTGGMTSPRPRGHVGAEETPRSLYTKRTLRNECFSLTVRHEILDYFLRLVRKSD